MNGSVRKLAIMVALVVLGITGLQSGGKASASVNPFAPGSCLQHPKVNKNCPTATPTGTATSTPVPSDTATATSTGTDTPTATVTDTPGTGNTATATATPTDTPTLVPSPTPTPTITLTPTVVSGSTITLSAHVSCSGDGSCVSNNDEVGKTVTFTTYNSSSSGNPGPQCGTPTVLTIGSGASSSTGKGTSNCPAVGGQYYLTCETSNTYTDTSSVVPHPVTNNSGSESAVGTCILLLPTKNTVTNNDDFTNVLSRSPSLPDLAIQSIVLDGPSGLTSNGYTVTVLNLGIVAVNLAGVGIQGYYGTNATTWPTNDPACGTSFASGTLNPGDTITLDVGCSGAPPPTDTYLVAKVDDTNIITESNENNNLGSVHL